VVGHRRPGGRAGLQLAPRAADYLGVRRRFLVACLCVVLAVTAAVVGLDRVTASFDRDANDVRRLHRAARSLLPMGAKVESESEGGCAELAAYPDCVFISFRRESSREEALRETTRRAASEGWRNTGEGWHARGGVMVVYERDGLRANVSIGDGADDYVQVRFWR
jgi:hypothetical protein